jgi:hypothetical protein
MWAVTWLYTAGVLLEKEVPEVFDIKFDLRRIVREPKCDSTAAANKIHQHLNDVMVKNRSKHFTSRPMKETHVFPLDEAQKLFETHYDIQAFLFRCIRTWLRWNRSKTTAVAVFSGTSSTIMNSAILTDLLIDDDLVEDSPSRNAPKDDFYSRGTKTFEPFFSLTTMAVLKPTDEKKKKSEYGKAIRYGRLFQRNCTRCPRDVLELSIHTFLERLLLNTGKEQVEWSKATESWLSVDSQTSNLNDA